MNLSPHAIALQGISYDLLLVATQGFSNVSRFTHAPKGGGFHARPIFKTRPIQMKTSRINVNKSDRAGHDAIFRPRQSKTFRR